MAMDRRELLRWGLGGAGALGLLSFSVGLPPGWLSRRAQPLPAPRAPAFLLWAHSPRGCPLNANVPGSYDHPDIVHPAQADFAPAWVPQPRGARLGARAWAALPRAVTDRLLFVHHAPETALHAAPTPAFLAPLRTQLAAALGVANGDVAAALARHRRWLRVGHGDDGLARLRRLRQATHGQLLRAKGTGQVASPLFGRFGWQQQADDEAGLIRAHRALVDNLQAAAGTGTGAALAGAVAAFQLGLTASAQVDMCWGGDNHRDAGLVQEARQQRQGIALLAELDGRLAAANLRQHTHLLATTTFGRTLARHHKGHQGRDHNAQHHVSLLYGPNVVGGVLGGVAPCGADFAAVAGERAPAGAPPNSGRRTTAAPGATAPAAKPTAGFAQVAEALQQALGLMKGAPRAGHGALV